METAEIKPDGMKVPQDEIKLTLKELTPLYAIVSRDNQIYNNIVWQFPTALITINGILIQILADNPPYILLIVTIINFGFLHALFKLGHNQHAIITALQNMEKEMKQINKSRFKEFLPDFEKDRHGILKYSSRNLISRILLGTNMIFFLIEVIRTIQFICEQG